MSVPLYSPGQQVRLRSRPDRVGHVTTQPSQRAGEYWYPVNFGPGRTSMHPEDDLDAYGDLLDSVESMLLRGRFATRDAFSKLITHLKLSTSLRSQIYALDASRTTFYAYQFKPLLKFLDSRSHRLLIADEVGLGKTIETGLILTELRQRRPMRRILLVPPSHLVIKWQDEMRRRFDLEFEVLNTQGGLEFLKRYEEEGDETELRAILSLQALRGRRLQDRWEEVSPSLDLVVFDEAGRLRNRDTRSHGAAERLAESADGMLLLTATPVQTGNTDLFNLLQLLDPEEFASFDVFQARLLSNQPVLNAQRLLATRDLSGCAEALAAAERTPMAARFLDNPLYRDVLSRLRTADGVDRATVIELQRDLNSLNVLGHVLSRTRKREVHENQPQRRPVLHVVDPSADEIQFYTEVTRICRAAYARANDGTVAAFATMMPQRQVASCMVAMVDYCLDRLGGAPPVDAPEASDLDVEDFEPSETPPAQSPIGWADLGDLSAWRERLSAHDSKWEVLAQVVGDLEEQEPGAKIVVFAFFKKTLRYLEARLSSIGISCVRVDGDVPSAPDDPERDERGKLLQRFEDDPSIRVLLSSEVGDEGIDLQFAHVLVNYDLPWNPMKVEQRIGRLDRLNQQSPVVTIVNLSMVGTIEDRVLNRLYQRIEIFRQSIGDLEEILGDEIKKLERDLFSSQLTEEEEARRIEQAAEVIVRRQQELKRFETAAEALVGHDDFFLEEIGRARQRGRYVGGQELLIYLRDFLDAQFRSCTIKEDGSILGLFRLKVNDDLRLFVRQRVTAGDLGLRLFLQRSTGGELLVTIDREYAHAHRRVEFLTFHHPLVRAVTRHYDEHPTELHPVSYVRASSKSIPPGSYVWFLYETEITGARPIRELDDVAFRLDSSQPLSVDMCEDLLSAMTTSASAVPPAKRAVEIPDTLPTRADEVLLERLDARFRDRQRTNDALVDNRLASIREGFERNLAIREDRLNQARMLGRKDTYVRGLDTGIRNLRAAHEARLREIEATRSLGRSYLLRGAGIVEVVADA